METQTHPYRIETDIGALFVEKDKDLGMEKDGTFLEAGPEKAYMKEHFVPGCTFVDIGAHVGFFSVFASSKLRSGYVHAFEPHPDNYRLLRKNFELHNIEGNASCFAIGSHSAYKKLYESTNNTGDHMVDAPGPTHTHKDMVSVQTLDTFSLWPQFMKIDVQGYEYHVLKGAENTIKKSRPHIMVEYSPWHLEAHGMSGHEFLDYVGVFTSLYKYKIECSVDPYELPSPQYTTLYLEPK